MNQQFIDYHLFSHQLDQLINPPNSLQTRPAIDYFEGYPMEDIGHFNDHLALKSFVLVLNLALSSQNEMAIMNAICGMITPLKHPDLNHAIRAYAGGKYETALFAGKLAQESALIDRSVNRHFACAAAHLVLIHAHANLGEDTAVIRELLAFKNTFECEIGAEVREWSRDLFDTFHQKWGNERFQTALFITRQQQANAYTPHYNRLFSTYPQIVE